MIPFVYLGVVMMAIAISDYKSRKIPNCWLLILMIGKLVFLAIAKLGQENASISSLFGKGDFLAMAIGFVAATVVAAVSYFLSKRQLGMGDVKLLAILGAYLGMGVFFEVLSFALLFACIYGVALILLKKGTWKMELPFAPFLLLGLFVEGGLLWYFNAFTSI